MHKKGNRCSANLLHHYSIESLLFGWQRQINNKMRNGAGVCAYRARHAIPPLDFTELNLLMHATVQQLT
jgi:hypothetical protein